MSVRLCAVCSLIERDTFGTPVITFIKSFYLQYKSIWVAVCIAECLYMQICSHFWHYSGIGYRTEIKSLWTLKKRIWAESNMELLYFILIIKKLLKSSHASNIFERLSPLFSCANKCNFYNRDDGIWKREFFNVHPINEYGNELRLKCFNLR